MKEHQVKKSRLQLAMAACRRSFNYVGLFSCLINLLQLTIPIYMMQIFDRVMASQSYDTLIFLTMIAIFAIGIMALLDGIRSRVLLRISHWLDNSLSPYVMNKSANEVMTSGAIGREALNDVNAVREFMCGNDIVILFDIPWSVIYIAVIYMLHPMLGMLTTGGAIILLSISFIGEIASRGYAAQARKQSMVPQAMVQTTMVNAESVLSMGMIERVVKNWFFEKEKVLDLQERVSIIQSRCLSFAKFIRMSLQIGILGLGAFLVVKGQFSPGSMIAASILTSRALAPTERIIGIWKKFINVRQSYSRLKEYTLAEDPHALVPILTPPKGILTVKDLIYRPPGQDSKPLLQGLNFQINEGEVIAIVGPSGAGKSTLARLMLGLWAPSHGKVSLDGLSMCHCDKAELGSYLGYLPQDVRLLDGSVRDNISRMQETDDESLVAVAKFTGVHELITSLPQGYNTYITGYSLSGGQQQRIALARAFYGNPCFVVLDEPNSNLDEVGIQQLLLTVRNAKKKGITVVLITHNMGLSQIADKIMIVNQGIVQAFEDTKTMLARMQQAQQNQPPQSPEQDNGIYAR